ncbi:MAG: ComF family protein [Sedimentisphaerales bacterium]|nr:ComF family protein [Sedimentisphaerales bacterium]
MLLYNLAVTTSLYNIGRFVLQGFSQLLWPAVCINCGLLTSHDDKGLCPKCWQEILQCVDPDYCPRCGTSVSRYILHNGRCPQCQQLEFHLDGLARAGIYGDALRKMIVAFKRDRTELDTHLSMLADSALRSSHFYDEIELFVPVPLHWRRQLSRGYNQAELLAKKLGHPRATISGDLARVRHTAMQPAVDFAKRKANVRGAFAVRRGHRFEGKTICLVDDVKTTGATLNECASVLKDAGAKKVYALVLATAGRSTA